MAGTFLALLGLTVTGMAPVTAAPSSGTADVVGNDVSYPQCKTLLPSSTAFAIVGVNGGLASTTNTCLGDQLKWALDATGAQSKIALYVNTANPGLAGSWWPGSNIYKSPITNEEVVVAIPSEMGKCEGGVDLACSYVYGYVRAYQDARERLKVPLGVASDPGSYFWWLDVETANSWQTGTNIDPKKDGPSLNRADLEGMVAYFSSIRAGVGIYSTGYQWGVIAGTVPSGTPLYGLPSWLAGARSLRGAKSNCSLSALTLGSKVTVTQYVSGGLDYDYSCPPVK
ncbi:glycoside hydrolase family 25 domain-containing protein [Arthrobacter sedimenti]|uniref:hypothetical protein n=1 Tax=Arthrobacter sedimenti TaxID=2694931 RepID=UPI001CDD4E77|nr:hypothetical protein [Arthrobacter sedimenti]